MHYSHSKNALLLNYFLKRTLKKCFQLPTIFDPLSHYSDLRLIRPLKTMLDLEIVQRYAEKSNRCLQRSNFSYQNWCIRCMVVPFFQWHSAANDGRSFYRLVKSGVSLSPSPLLALPLPPPHPTLFCSCSLFSTPPSPLPPPADQQSVCSL